MILHHPFVGDPKDALLRHHVDWSPFQMKMKMMSYGEQNGWKRLEGDQTSL
jgi:hypothetical protein